ncbi:arylsulfatase [Ulvibacterium sp.]|uniref:arylsulfatase n=1 Tax=Ulvibacterium sp. TaxID=2665914 RepID=UPI0026093C9C|nr:arylsulfatase [Ulvibacterium sp.]
MKRPIRYILLFCTIYLWPASSIAQQRESPNIVLIITDDQGYGDLGVTGNPHVKTPTLDAFARESVRFTNFYVSPVCAPTRASLMTGRYSLRTGIRDTYNGGAIMASNEVTIAEMLKQADYRTGIFGKWHLGDNYPSRPQDQGFDESVIHLAGGMGQVGDFTTYFKGDRSYFDPVLWHNGKQEAYTGYCSDIFTNQAIRFIEKSKSGPFFCYLSFNAPHTPLQVPQEYYDRYKDIDPSSGFENDNRPFVEMTEKDKEDARKVYAMVSNIDDNLTRLFQKLKELKLEKNTIVIFMTDNGPQQVRYVAGMKGRKGSVYRGGVRVPFYLRYPGKIKGNRDIATMAAHIDVLPTLSELCNLKSPEDRKLDGRSLLPLIQKKAGWQERPLFFYWTRKYPVRYMNMALQQGPYKLVAQTNFDASPKDFELYHILNDPYEQHNLATENTTTVENLKTEMDKTYKELIGSKNLLNPPPIVVGTQNENPIFLNRNDAGGERGIWNQEEVFGKWNVVLTEGLYNIKFKFVQPVQKGGTMFLETGSLVSSMENDTDGMDSLEMTGVSLPDMKCDLIPFYAIDGRHIFPFWVEMERIQ